MTLLHLISPATLPRWPLALAVLAAAMLLGACSTESRIPKPETPGVPVSVAIVETGAAVQYGEYAARVRSPGAVELRAQVGGVLKQRLYQEGQYIQKGEALFQIDPEPHVLALRQTQAELSEARAEHANSERESRRQQDLFARQVSSEHDKDRAATALQAALATLQKAEAAESDAKRLLR
ncbi:MAG: biotin/lipoyl-binding protein, partial [Haliea sp.]